MVSYSLSYHPINPSASCFHANAAHGNPSAQPATERNRCLLCQQPSEPDHQHPHHPDYLKHKDWLCSHQLYRNQIWIANQPTKISSLHPMTAEGNDWFGETNQRNPCHAHQFFSTTLSWYTSAIHILKLTLSECTGFRSSTLHSTMLLVAIITKLQLSYYFI